MRYRYKNKKITTERPSEENKEIIYNFIVRNKGRAKPDEIQKGTGLSLQTVNVHLKALIKEWKIVKVAYGEYRLRDRRLGEIYSFTSVLKKASHVLLGSYAIDPQYDEFGSIKPQLRMEDSIDFDLLRTAANGTVSNKYCKTRFTKDAQYEKYLFEFVNRVGAFMAYTFIESLKPIDWEPSNEAMITEKEEYTSALIRKAIDLDLIFSDFCRLFDIISHPHKSRQNSDKERKTKRISDLLYHDWPKINKAETEDYDRLSDLLRRVYPGVHSGLERYWSENVISTLMESKFVLEKYASFDHTHKWAKEKLYKTEKEYYVCRVCAALSSDPVESNHLDTNV